MTALEPILIVVIALIVGFVAVSIVMAVMKLTSGMGV
jgi:type II secretory pathway component PulF